MPASFKMTRSPWSRWRSTHRSSSESPTSTSAVRLKRSGKSVTIEQSSSPRMPWAPMMRAMVRARGRPPAPSDDVDVDPRALAGGARLGERAERTDYLALAADDLAHVLLGHADFIQRRSARRHLGHIDVLRTRNQPTNDVLDQISHPGYLRLGSRRPSPRSPGPPWPRHRW